jgi:hypothetical protein
MDGPTFVPNRQRAEVPASKVAGYMLNLAHRAGAAKAEFLLARGFDAGQPDTLAAALRAHVGTHPVVASYSTAHGLKYIVEGPLECPDGSSPGWRSVWIVEPGSPAPRFVTGVPRMGRGPGPASRR